MSGAICRDTDAAWLAGLFDGEGHVRINKSKYVYKNKYSDRYYYGLFCKVNMTHKETIEHIKAILAYGTIYKCTVNKKHPEWKIQWRFSTTGVNAYKFMKSIQPYAVTKKKEIDLAIEYYEKFVLSKRHKNEKLSDETRNQIDIYYLELQSLRKYEYTQ